MTYTLALELKMPVAELRRRVPSSEFSEWMGFFEWRGQVRAEAERQAASGRGTKRGGMGRG